jgi:prefoldin subunit 5
MSDSPQPIETTTTGVVNVDAFIPSVIPALQSASYIIVLALGVVAWSSRKLAVDFLTKHIELVESLKENLDESIDNLKIQTEHCDQLISNNEKLVETVAKLAEGK